MSWLHWPCWHEAHCRSEGCESGRCWQRAFPVLQGQIHYITNLMWYWRMIVHVSLEIILHALALVHYLSHLSSCHRWFAGCYNDTGALGSAGWLMRCPKQKWKGAYENVWMTVPVVDLRGLNQTIDSNQEYIQGTNTYNTSEPQWLISKVTFTKKLQWNC